MSLGERAGRARQQRLPTRTDQWIHSAVDLGAGQIITTALAGPPTAQERVAALSQLAPALVGTTFGEPLVRLSARTPYLPGQQCFFEATTVDGFLPDSEVTAPDGNQYGYIEWFTEPGTAPPPGQRGMSFYFGQIPQLNPVVLSIPISGQSGHVSLGYVSPGQQGPPSGQVSVAFPATGAVQWLDVLYQPYATTNPYFLLSIEPDNVHAVFTYAVLELPSQVVNPPPRLTG
jgi:hypothetical protein